MKKISCLSLVLCLALLFQLFFIPVMATETETQGETQEETQGEETLPVMDEADSSALPDVAFGTASVTNGCRTMDGQISIGASDIVLDSAQAAFVYEMNTGTVLYSHNPDTTLNQAALTKILTAIIAIEACDLEEQVTISTANHGTLPVGARNSDLKQDEVLTMKDLLHLMILDLSNDAALAIAEHVAGSESAFVDMMNEKAQSLGCTNTLFTSCHGVDMKGQHSTARDLGRIIQYAVKNSEFQQLFGATDYTVEETNRSTARELTTLNYLLEQLNVTKFIDDRVTGGVATYTSSAGASLACTADSNGLSLIIIVLGCSRTYNSYGVIKSYGNYEEVWDLLAYSFDNYRVCRLLHDGQSMNQFTVANGESQVVGQTTTAMDAVLPKNATYKNLILKYNVTGGGLTAPITQGQEISTLQIWYRSSCIAETKLYAMSSVRDVNDLELEIQSAGRDDSDMKIWSFIGIVCLIILVPSVVYLTVNQVRRTIARNRRRIRRRNRRRNRSHDGLE